MADPYDRQDHVTLTAAQHTLLAKVLDTVVPRKGKLAAAGAAGIVDYIDDVLTDSEPLRRLFLDGLADVEIASGAAHSAPFGSLSVAKKKGVLRDVEAKQPEFFEALVEHTYKGYYSSPEIVRLLGLEARPPQPVGYALKPFDPATLDSVKKRGKVYREA